MTCAWCKELFVPVNARQRYCTKTCKKKREYWHAHKECFETQPTPKPRPFVFCRTGDHTKCPVVVDGKPCICDCHTHVLSATQGTETPE